jgi:hypothetical protein
MNKKNLFNDIVALPPSQQEDVAQYVSSLKKRVVLPVNDVVVLEMLGDDDDFMQYLNDYALQPQTIEELRDIFEDAPSAEELCEMLTK